jgi:hypothetical protein
MGRLAQSAGRPQRFKQKVGTIAYGSGPQALPVPSTDYVTSFDLISNQTITTGATSPVIAGYGAYGPLGLIQVKVNGGRAPFSMPAYHANIFNTAWNDVYNDVLAASAVTVSSTLNWKNHVRVPLTIDPITNKGAWYTGDNQLQMTVGLVTNPLTAVFSTVNGATIGGSWDVWAEKFNAPQPDLPGGWLEDISYYHQMELYQTVQLINGTQQVVLPVEVDYVRILLVFYTGNNNDSTFAPADGLYTNLTLLANEKIRLFDAIDEQSVRFDFVQTNSKTNAPKPGTAILDFMRIDNSVRDVVPTDGARRMVLNIASTNSAAKCDVVMETSADSQFSERWYIAAARNAGGH